MFWCKRRAADALTSNAHAVLGAALLARKYPEAFDKLDVRFTQEGYMAIDDHLIELREDSVAFPSGECLSTLVCAIDHGDKIRWWDPSKGEWALGE